MKKYLLTVGIIITILIVGFIYYFQAHITIWGFNIRKSELKDVLIYTKGNSYMVTDSESVLELSNEVSKMEKLNKIDNNFPPNNYKVPKFVKIIIQTKDNVTFGGSFWEDGDGVVMDSSGYYWKATNDLFDLMDKTLKNGKNHIK